MEVEEHPFRWYVPENAGTLIIGTFPPLKKWWGYQFFYPNPRNLFWKMMSDISGITISEDEKDPVGIRKRIMDKLETGVTDMAAAIRRLANNSLDENLELVEAMDILGILREHASIKQIILTSSSGKASAYGWFKQYMNENGIPVKVTLKSKPLQFAIPIDNRVIDVFVLYSPSRRAANRISYDALVAMYSGVIMRDKLKVKS